MIVTWYLAAYSTISRASSGVIDPPGYAATGELSYANVCSKYGEKMLYLYAASVRISRFKNSVFGIGPRDQSSDNPRCDIAGQSRSVGASSTASLPTPRNSCFTVCAP